MKVNVNMKAGEKRELCPVIEAIRRVGNENKLIIIYELFQGGKGFNELQRETGLNSKTLSKTLKELESEGIIRRAIINDRPFRVKYELTEKGMELNRVFDEIRRWATKYLDGRY
ncbi:MAG: helix-turn-helix domain-containing protein [Sulfolobaceae archaeon]